ncbi:MAG: hypothetical protein HY681_15100 [Chloroflexi bacterium]|nr:hypothetical protein [Chloroflexota bacterium]
MGHIIIRLYPSGRVERSEKATTWREREELLAFALYLQPGLAALDVSARIWRDLNSSHSLGRGGP